MRNFRLAFRALAKQPIFALAAVLTLALGIGANTAIFSVFNTIILQPLPFRDPDRLVLLWQKRPDGHAAGVAAVNYQEWVKQAGSFEQLSGVFAQYFNFRSGQESTQVIGAQVTPGFIRSLGIQPVLGSGFDSREDAAGAAQMVLLSYRFWQNELGADRNVLGRTAEINGRSYTIAGVLPREINFPMAFRSIQLWTALQFDPGFRMTANILAIIGRLKPGISIPQADREMQLVSRNLESEFPDLDKRWSAMVLPLHEYGMKDVRPALVGLLVAVAFILLIACVNVANLLLARAEIRQKEVAIRSALGASQARILGELVAENLLLAFTGGIAGLALAYAGVRLLIIFDSSQLPGMDRASLDARVLGFTLVITVLAALLFGLFPARQLLASDLNHTLRQASRTIQGSMGRRSRDLLVIAQVALSLVLVTGAGLMMRSVLYLETGNRGFLPEHLLSFRVSFTGSDLSNEKRMGAYYLEMLGRIEHLPGVRAVAATTNVPLDGYLLVGENFRIDGAAPTSLSERPTAACGLINSGYFKAIGIPLLQGREFNEHDREGAPPVAVISATVARRFFSNQNPIGRKIVVPTPGKATIEVVREIVGVVGDIKYFTRAAEESAEIYLPYLQTVWPVTYVMVRTDGEPKAFFPSVRAALRDSGFDQPIAEVRSMDERIAEVNGKPRLNAMLAAIFSGLALVLMAVGMYGVISYSTAQRAQEIGVRVALGATANKIVKWIVGQAILLCMAGVMVGLAGHFALSRVLGSLLYGIGANDAATLAGVIALLIVIAILASYIPARRAVRGDPMAALRAE